ncbi:darobactin export ABC transporter permease subunit [Pseudoalteromonas maricaloris]|uniref:darobactin export ABC transporter permease subunit n=1 Tax=Pseudoalteromonas maricaloris TaxID=184924 RepID=UPI000299D182|nr:darobactin export ABC transporter permease subunit [Pseudoalteromonas flavipulchra]
MSKLLSDGKALSAVTGVLSLSLGAVLLGLMFIFFLADSSINSGLSSDIYKIETQFNLPSGETVVSSKAPAALIPVLEKDQAVKRVGKVYRENITILYNDIELKGIEVYALDKTAQLMLNLGSEELGISGAFISSTLAEKIAEDKSKIIGKTIKINNTGLYRIEKVIKIDDTLSIQPDVIVNFDHLYNGKIKESYTDWYDTHLHLFVELVNRNDLDLEKIVSSNAPQIPGAPFTPSSFINLSKRAVSDLHYDRNHPDALGITFSKSSLYLIFGICIFSFILGTVGFLSSIISIKISQLDRIKTLTSIGGSEIQIIFISLLENKNSLIIANITSAILLYLILPPLSGEFDILSTVNTEEKLFTLSLIIITITSLYTLSNVFVIKRVLSYQSDESITKSTGLKTMWLTKVTVFLQMLITSIVIFIAVSLTYELFTEKKADYGYDIAKSHFIKLDGVNDVSPITLRNKINAEYGEVSAVASWHPFEKSSHFVTVSTAQQKIDQNITPINYFYAGEEFIKVFGLNPLDLDSIIQSNYDSHINGKTRVVVTQAFANLYDNIPIEKLSMHKFYADLGNGVEEIEIVKVVSDFFLSKIKPFHDPIMIVLNEEKATSVLLNTSNRIVDRISINNKLDFSSSYAALESEYSDLSKIANYLLWVVALNIVLISLNTIANSLVDVERNSYTLDIMKQLGAGLKDIFSYTLKNNIYLYTFSSLVGTCIGYYILKDNLLISDNFSFGFTSYIFSSMAIAAIFISVIILSFFVVSKKYLERQ